MGGNLIVNGLLCYLESARQSYDDEMIIVVCLYFYNSKKIAESKELLFSSVEEEFVRRGDGKPKSDLVDMLNLLRKCDEENLRLRSSLQIAMIPCLLHLVMRF